MKCVNPTKCDGEMKSYKGLRAGKVECSTCGYRTDAPKETPKPKAEKKEVVQPEPNKEN